MVSLRLISSIALVILCVVPTRAAQSNSTCIELPTSIEAAIKKHASAMRAAEFCDIRKVDSGDLNGDGRKDFAIAYSLEGPCANAADDRKATPGSCGNLALQFVAIFLGKPSGFQMMSGRSVEPAIETLKIIGSRIQLETLDWTATDPHCCPSKKGRLEFKVVNGKVQQIQQTPGKRKETNVR
jgi:hypothetical protein